jgi:hypothetical protein
MIVSGLDVFALFISVTVLSFMISPYLFVERSAQMGISDCTTADRENNPDCGCREKQQTGPPTRPVQIGAYLSPFLEGTKLYGALPAGLRTRGQWT